jgi:DNA-binding NtrC family response regulator
VADNRLREDLFYRLSTIEVKLPRLAERREDLPLLQRHFLNSFSTRYNKPTLNLTRRAQTIITRHSWPGNIRELENVINYACMIAAGKTIDLEELPDYLRNDGAQADDVQVSLRRVELRHLHRVLAQVGGNLGKAAGILGISRTTMYRLLDEEKRGRQPASHSAEPGHPIAIS